jgi:hypothetical protein
VRTSIESGSATEERRAPDWSPVPDPATAGSRPAVAAAWRAAAGIAAVALLWWLGHRLPALVLLTVLLLATAASLRFPAVASQLDRATRAIQRVAGRILALVLLSLVQLLIFAPLSLLFWLVRRDPLALGRPPDAPSLWRPTPERPGRPLHRRQFSYERPAASERGVRHGRLPPLRAVLGLIALLGLLDVAAGATLHALDHTGDPRPTAQSQTPLLSADVAAGRHEPWVSALGRELGQVWSGKRYDPYLGWTTRHFNGRYVHTAGETRRSYKPADSQARGAIRVYFFGGSSMFGYFQRDEHTIPSEFARLAEADGIPVRVLNYGQVAYVNWQEVLLFEELVSRGRVPDLAVFYDGANELVNQFRDRPHAEPSQVLAPEFAKRLALGGAQTAPAEDTGSPLGELYRSWKDVSAVRWLSLRVRGLATERAPSSAPIVPQWAGKQDRLAARAGGDAASVYARGVDLARRLAAGYGIRTAFFWQPFLYSKQPVADEANPLGLFGTEPDAWRRADAVARSKLRPPVVDLSDALDPVGAPVMYDYVHTNERGAKVVARALYERLAPTLRELQRRGRR